MTGERGRLRGLPPERPRGELAPCAPGPAATGRQQGRGGRGRRPRAELEKKRMTGNCKLVGGFISTYLAATLKPPYSDRPNDLHCDTPIDAQSKIYGFLSFYKEWGFSDSECNQAATDEVNKYYKSNIDRWECMKASWGVTV